MKRLPIISTLLAFTLLVFTMAGFAQYASKIRPLPTLPATCNPLNGEVVMLTTGAGVSPGIYNCTATNTWRPAGAQGNQFNFDQGTITTSTPFINHTVTWNNAAETFFDIVSTITDTNSAASSSLFRGVVSGTQVFRVQKTGTVQLADASEILFGARSRMVSGVNGVLTIQNNATDNFTRLTLGPPAVTNPAITVSNAVGGQTQGIIITKGDGAVAIFGDLGAATNGSMIYCSTCTVANPCAGAGTGAIAKRLNGVWVCN